MTDTIVGVLLVAVAIASFGYLAWLLFAVWTGRGWLPPKKEERSDEELGSMQEAGFETYGPEECYQYCKEHAGLGDADAWLPCEQVCRT